MHHAVYKNVTFKTSFCYEYVCEDTKVLNFKFWKEYFLKLKLKSVFIYIGSISSSNKNQFIYIYCRVTIRGGP